MRTVALSSLCLLVVLSVQTGARSGSKAVPDDFRGVWRGTDLSILKFGEKQYLKGNLTLMVHCGEQWSGDLSGEWISSSYGGAWTSRKKRIFLEHDESSMSRLVYVIGTLLIVGGGTRDGIEITKLKVKTRRKFSKKLGHLMKYKMIVRFEQNGVRGRWKRMATLEKEVEHAFVQGTVSYQGAHDPGGAESFAAAVKDAQGNVVGQASPVMGYTRDELAAGAELRIDYVDAVEGPCTLEVWWDTFPNRIRGPDEPFGTIPFDRIDGGEVYCGVELTLEDPE